MPKGKYPRGDWGGDRNPPQLTGEEWRPVADHPHYMVSNLGRVCSLKLHAPRILRPARREKGYLTVMLYQDGVSRTPYVHKLVGLAFLGPRPDGYQTAHLNGDPADNRAANLMWVTAAVNNRHKDLHGTAQRGARGTNAKLTDGQVVEIRQAFGSLSVAQIAGKFGVHRDTILDIKNGRTWTSLTSGPVAGINRENDNDRC